MGIIGGLNGAGTLMKIIAGLVEPTRNDCVGAGYSVFITTGPTAR